jgi:hypothetical protein
MMNVTQKGQNSRGLLSRKFQNYQFPSVHVNGIEYLYVAQTFLCPYWLQLFTCGSMLIFVQVLDFYIVWMWAVLLMFRRYTLLPFSGLKSVRWVSFCEYEYMFLSANHSKKRRLVPFCCPYWVEWGSSLHFSSVSCFEKTYIRGKSLALSNWGSTYHWNFGNTAHRPRHSSSG